MNAVVNPRKSRGVEGLEFSSLLESLLSQPALSDFLKSQNSSASFLFWKSLFLKESQKKKKVHISLTSHIYAAFIISNLLVLHTQPVPIQTLENAEMWGEEPRTAAPMELTAAAFGVLPAPCFLFKEENETLEQGLC